MDIYREFLLDLYHHPQHKRINEHATHTERGYNPSCGDDLMIYLVLEEDIIIDCCYEGSGCVLAIAGASVMADHCIGKSISEIRSLTTESVYDLLGLPYDPTRVKCVTLCFRTIQHMIK